MATHLYKPLHSVLVEEELAHEGGELGGGRRGVRIHLELLNVAVQDDLAELGQRPRANRGCPKRVLHRYCEIQRP